MTLLQQTKLLGLEHGLTSARDMQLLEDVLHVRTHGPHRDGEGFRDFLVVLPLGQHLQGFEFPIGQRLNIGRCACRPVRVGRARLNDGKPATKKPRPRYCGCGVYWPQALDVVRRGKSDADHPKSSVQRPSRPQVSRQAGFRKHRNDRSGLPILEQPTPLARPCKALASSY